MSEMTAKVLTRRQGLTLLELVVSLSLFLLLATPLFTLFVVSNHSANYDISATDARAKGRASLELISRQFKKIVSVNADLDQTAGRSRIEFTTLEDMGTANSWPSWNRILSDFDKEWQNNIYTGATVRIRFGTGAGQERAVLANSSVYLLVDPAWSEIPDETSVYEILVDQELYIDQEDYDPAELVYARVIWDPLDPDPAVNEQPFGRNISGLTLWGYDEFGTETSLADEIAALQVQIDVQGEARSRDPDEPFKTYVLKSQVKLRLHGYDEVGHETTT